MLGLIGKKLGMTQIFDEEGKQIPVTVLEVGPCYVTALRTPDTDGYNAVQLSYSETKEKKLTKADLGRFKKAGTPNFTYTREIRTENLEGLQLGQQVGADNFEAGDWIDVQGISVGRGFQGVVKRHHFKGAQTMSHGTKMGREPGSVGSRAGGVGCRKNTPKGKRMPGRMGNEQVTVQNIKVVRVDSVNNLLLVRGAVPGPENRCLVVRTALKRPVNRNWKVPAAKTESSTTQEASSPDSPEKNS
ncbi:MAG: 50S ribosomal protein L3 [Candidatus Omnitrophica bacterium]|nr:50S ribosomal protein L3 [Candidatus Omnitrophota bacterium]